MARSEEGEFGGIGNGLTHSLELRLERVDASTGIFGETVMTTLSLTGPSGTTTLSGVDGVQSTGNSVLDGDVFDYFVVLSTGDVDHVLDNFVVEVIDAVGPSADFDDDGDVDDVDLAQWEGSFGIDAGGDADGDLDSDGADFLLWQRNFTGPGAVTTAAVVPEPGSIAMLLLAALGFLGKGFRSERHSAG